MKFFVILIMNAFAVSCTVLQKEKEYSNDWKLFSKLEVGKDNQEVVKRKLGMPEEVYTEQLEANEEQWNYMRNGTPKIRAFFVDKVLQFSSTSVWDGEAVADIPYLLKEFPGQWKVEQEPVTIPHAMPFLCYLVDESSGKRVEIHAYQKIVESIFRWNPKMPQKKNKNMNKYPDVDENRCAWLTELIKK